MEIGKNKGIIEAILFASGRVVKVTELMSILELGKDEVTELVEMLKTEYDDKGKGMKIISVEDGFQMCTREEFYEYLYPIFDKRNKPNLSNAALETLAIIAYNPKITRSEIEAIRGVNCDGTIYKLLEYNLIEDAGRKDLPGRPTAYKTSENFLKTFGYSNIDELPELPKYKLDENQQIVLEEIVDQIEAPSPAGVNQENENVNNNE